MYIRKLVKSGAASHTIALPKGWLIKNNLKKGDLLYLTEKNNQLNISSKTRLVKQEISIAIDNKEINGIRRKTISAYINNYNIFVFHGNSLNTKLEEIRKILHNFLALEIVEQTATKLVAKDFLNLQEFSLKNTIRRMDMLTRSILTDAKKGKKEYKVLYFRDFEVDKLFFLISRIIRTNLSSPSSSIPGIKSMSTWWLAKNLERIADAAKNISKVFDSDIKRIYNEIEQYYLECIKSYFINNKELADELINKRVELLEKCESLKNSKKIPNTKKILKESFWSIKEEQKCFLKDMINNSRNISKIVLDSED